MTLRLKAQVRGGRLVMDEPTDLPEGTEIALISADEGEELDDHDLEQLRTALALANGQFNVGEGIPADLALGQRAAPSLH